MKTRQVIPCGKLWTHQRNYFLLHPYPIDPDSWQGENAYRWVVVPTTPINDVGSGDANAVYSHARHIVTNSFAVEYTQLPEITIVMLDELDLTEIELIYNPVENEPNSNQLQMEELNHA